MATPWVHDVSTYVFVLLGKVSLEKVVLHDKKQLLRGKMLLDERSNFNF